MSNIIELVFSEEDYIPVPLELIFGDEESSSCDPDWVDQPGNELVIDFVSCDVRLYPFDTDEWDPDRDLDLDDDLDDSLNLGSSVLIDSYFREWFSEAGDQVNIDLDTELETDSTDLVLSPPDGSVPDWESQSGNNLNIDFNCCDSEDIPTILGRSSVIVDLITDGEGETSVYPVIYGNGTAEVYIVASGQGYHDIEGHGETIVDLLVEGYGARPIDGDGDTTVNLSQVGVGALEKYGTGNTPVDLLTTGTGVREIFGESETIVDLFTNGVIAEPIPGHSSITVNLNTIGASVRQLNGYSEIELGILYVGTGGLEKYAHSSVLVDLNTVGFGVRETSGNSSIILDVDTNGSGVWTGGPEIFGESETNILVRAVGQGQFLGTIYAFSELVVGLDAQGKAITQKVFDDLEGDSIVEVGLYSEGIGEIPQFQSKSFDIPIMDLYDQEVVIEITMHVDIDNEIYEIRKVETNTEYLKDYRYGMWKTRLDLGWKVKDEFSWSEDLDDYKVYRDTVLRKYGASLLVVRIVISDRYQFIKNPVNVTLTIDREVDRALLDTYGLYRLEFE